MGHEPAHGTQGAAVSHALLFLAGARNPDGAGGRQIDDGFVLGRAGDIHHDAVAAPAWVHHTGRRTMRLYLADVHRREGQKSKNKQKTATGTGH
jgi:hypothetical protein